MLDLDIHFWANIYFLSEWAIRLVMLAVVPLRRGPQAANAWLILIFFLPWPGLVLFLMIGSPKLPPARRERLVRLVAKMAPVIERLKRSPYSAKPPVAPELVSTVELATRLGHFRLLGGNRAELLADYQGSIDRLVADIDAAVHHVHLLYYIFTVDATTTRIIEALARATKRGVRCRVLADALGNKRGFKALTPRLAEAGVELHKVLPYSWLRWLRGKKRMDLRNHRKIAVIDGRIGYTGSQNLVDPAFKPGIVYEELVIRLEGPVVLQLQFVFAADWFGETEEALDDVQSFPDPVGAGDLPAQALPSGPTFPTENNQRLLVSLVHAALKRVVLTTPYFIPDEAFLQALQTAVLRGVEVDLVVSAEKDQMLVGLAQESYYEQLLAMGVRIHRYHENFLHAKHASFDDAVVFIGSSNMDVRSFMLNGEISMVCYDEALAHQLRLQQERYFRGAKRLTLEEWANRSRWRRLGQGLARLMSPLL